MTASIVFLEADKQLVASCAVLMRMHDYQSLFNEVMLLGRQFAILDGEAWEVFVDWAITEMRVKFPWHAELPSSRGIGCPVVFAVSAEQIDVMRREWRAVKWDEDTATGICECYSKDPKRLSHKIDDTYLFVMKICDTHDRPESIFGCVVSGGVQ